MILVFVNVNTGVPSYGIEGLSGSFLADGRPVPASPVWEETDGADLAEIPEGAAGALRARVSAQIAADEKARAEEKAAEERKVAKDRAYAAWYNSPAQVSKRARDSARLDAFIKGMFAHLGLTGATS